MVVFMADPPTGAATRARDRDPRDAHMPPASDGPQALGAVDADLAPLDPLKALGVFALDALGSAYRALTHVEELGRVCLCQIKRPIGLLIGFAITSPFQPRRLRRTGRALAA
jgi:hypothetical protein